MTKYVQQIRIISGWQTIGEIDGETVTFDTVEETHTDILEFIESVNESEIEDKSSYELSQFRVAVQGEQENHNRIEYAVVLNGSCMTARKNEPIPYDCVADAESGIQGALPRIQNGLSDLGILISRGEFKIVTLPEARAIVEQSQGKANAYL